MDIISEITIRIHSARIIAVAMLGFLCAAEAQMLPPTSFSVPQNGAAIYNIPIEIPPGVAGFQPQLSLVYNSMAGDGFLGKGWVLDGLGVISRCPQTLAQDGYAGAVNYDRNDRFCVDGERMVLVSGSYGGDGSTYRKERDDFSLITAFGSSGSGPERFEIKTKSGLVLSYGSTATSRFLVQSSSTVRAWMLSRRSNANGSFIGYDYYQDFSSPEIYPVKIYYGNAEKAVGSLHLSYDIRPDIVLEFHAGTFSNTKHRISSISLLAGDAKVYDYNFTYAYSGRNDVSRIIQVSKCAPQSTCQDIKFTWSAGGSPVFEKWTWNSGERRLMPGDRSYVADVNGDGMADLIGVGGIGYANAGTVYVSLSDGNTLPTWIWNSGSRLLDDNGQLFFGDVNGDGKADIIHIGQADAANAGTVYVGLSTGTAFESWTWVSGPGRVNKSDRVYLADINGDGRSDLIAVAQEGVPNAGVIHVGLSNGSSFAGWSSYSASRMVNEKDKLFFLDVNGDGKDDLVAVAQEGFVNAGYIYISISDGVGFNQWTWNSGSRALNADDRILWGDVNGDGKPDMVAVGQEGTLGAGQVYVGMSTGLTIETWRWHSSSRFLNANDQPFLVDMNADGRADLFVVGGTGSTNSGVLYTGLSNGTGFEAWTADSGNRQLDDDGPVFFGDFNGDGQDDLLTIGKKEGAANLGYVHIGLNKGDGRRLISNFINQLGEIRVNYGKSATEGFYIRDASATYPVVDVGKAPGIVKETFITNGLGTENARKYIYAGLKVAVASGRGSLGFRQISDFDLSANTLRQMTMRQDWPFIGLESLADHYLLSQSYFCRTLPNLACISSRLKSTMTFYEGSTGSTAASTFVRASKVIESSWDLLGNPMLATTSTFEYQPLNGEAQYGNVSKVTVADGAGLLKIVNNEYYPANTSNGKWILGRLKKSTSIHSK